MDQSSLQATKMAEGIPHKSELGSRYVELETVALATVVLATVEPAMACWMKSSVTARLPWNGGVFHA